MNLPMIDTDVWIEQKVGKAISLIFSDEGEQTFREYERKCLQLLPTEDVIITTGGGIVIQGVNRHWMKEHGLVVYLHCEPKEIYNRLQADQTRPLLAENKMEKIDMLLNRRLRNYKEADIIIDTTKKQNKRDY